LGVCGRSICHLDLSGERRRDRKKLFSIDVRIGKRVTRTLRVYDGDDPMDVANAFVMTHSLSKRKKDRLLAAVSGFVASLHTKANRKSEPKAAPVELITTPQPQPRPKPQPRTSQPQSTARDMTPPEFALQPPSPRPQLRAERTDFRHFSSHHRHSSPSLLTSRVHGAKSVMSIADTVASGDGREYYHTLPLTHSCDYIFAIQRLTGLAAAVPGFVWCVLCKSL
jgi:hypothetical protein